MFVFVTSVIAVTLLLTKYFYKRYNIIANFGLYRPVNNTQKRVENTLMILFIILVVIVVFVFSYTKIYVLIFGFLAILSSYRTFMEYKYDREEKNYIINFLWAISNSVLSIGCMFFTF